MAIDLLNLQPSVISRDLRGKYVCIYSLPKMGKTTLACQFPKNLLLGFEHGWNAISGAMAIDITKWSDFKLALRQLEKPEVKALYDTITIDTVAIAWEACEEYICAQNGVQKIGDIPWGGGYAACKKEFEKTLRKITQLGYGLVIIAHVVTRKEKQPGTEDGEIEILAPAIPKRCYEIVNQIVDIIGYIGLEWDEEGNSSRWLYTRRTPTIMAGSRFKYLKEKIPFGYTDLVNAIAEAIEKQEKIDGATVVENSKPLVQEENLNYNELKAEAMKLWSALVGEGENADAAMAQRILGRVEKIFDKPGMRLSDITENQCDLYVLVLDDMRQLLAEKMGK